MMLKRTWSLVGFVAAAWAAGRANAQIIVPLTSAGGSQTAAGDVFVVGQTAVGFSSGAHDLEHGAVPCWFAPSACPGDADGDNDVDISDLGLLLSDFGMSGAGIPGDVDGDGNVNISDLGLVLSHFGETCL